MADEKMPEVPWGKGVAPVKLKRRSAPSYKPRPFRRPDWRRPILRAWLMGGFVAAIAGGLLGLGYFSNNATWLPLGEQEGVVYYGNQPLTLQNGPGGTQIWRGVITLALRTTAQGEAAASSMQVGEQHVTVACLENQQQERCVIKKSSWLGTQTYQVVDKQVNGCWYRYLGGKLLATECVAGGMQLLPWVLPSGIVG